MARKCGDVVFVPDLGLVVVGQPAEHVECVQALEEKNREVAGDEGSDDDFEEGMGDIDVESKPALAID